MSTRQNRIRPLLATGATAAVAATAVNATIYGLGRAAGVDFVIKESAADGNVLLQHVVSLSLMAFAVGLVAALVVAKVGRPSLRALQVLGAVLAVVSTYSDFTIDGTIAATLTLASMHIVVGIAYIATLQRAQSTSSTVPVRRTRLEAVAA